MDIKYILPFLDGLINILEQFGMTDIKRSGLYKKDYMAVDKDVTAIIGIVGELRGNVAYSMSQDTARNIVSSMMMGMPVEEMDAISRSAIGELSNMITGNASILLSNNDINVDITPPSIVFGSDIFFIISSVDTITVDLETPAGNIEVNIGLEL